MQAKVAEAMIRAASDDHSEKPAFAAVARLYADLGRRFTAASLASRDEAGCLRRAGELRSTGIGGARLGSRRADVLRRLGVPAERTAQSMRYCVQGGGKLLMAFDAGGRLRLAASTSFSTHIRGLRTGSSLVHVKRIYPRARWIGKQLLRASRTSRVVFGSCSCGALAFVAVTNLSSPAKIRYYASKAGVPRAR
jgi:hypothetical protein